MIYPKSTESKGKGKSLLFKVISRSHLFYGIFSVCNLQRCPKINLAWSINTSKSFSVSAFIGEIAFDLVPS
jgi:hypothetical protein